MMPSDLSEPPRSEVSKVKWFTEGVSFTFEFICQTFTSNFRSADHIAHKCTIRGEKGVLTLRETIPIQSLHFMIIMHFYTKHISQRKDHFVPQVTSSLSLSLICFTIH